MSKIIGNEMNIRIARLIDVLRVTHLDGKVYYDGENYVEDLNAMHEVIETVLISDATHDQHNEFCSALSRICKEDGKIWYSTINATAEQRAEAFVKTMEGEE